MKRLLAAFALSLILTTPALADKVASPLPVGIAVAQTTNVGLFGQEQVNGAKVAEAMLNARGGVNGTPFVLAFQDTGGDEAGAVNAFQNLISRDKVLGIVGPTLSQQAFAADPIANQAGVPVISPSNTAKGIPQIGEFISRISAPMTVVAPNSIKKALKLNPAIKKAAVVYAQDDAFSTSETTVFQEALKTLGIEVVTVQKTSTKDTDFTTQVTAILGENADLVVISGLAADSGNLVKQLRQLGFGGLIVGGNGLNSPNMYPVCGKLCEGVILAQAYTPSAANDMNKAFVAEFKKTFGKDPAQFSAQSFTAVQVMVEALAKAEKAAGKKLTEMELDAARVALNKAIPGSYATPLGEIAVSPEGEVTQKDFYVSRIKMLDDKTGSLELMAD